MVFILIVLALDAYLSPMVFFPMHANYPIIFWVSFLTLQLFFLSLLWLFFVFFKGNADEQIRFEESLRDTAFMGMGVISFLLIFSAVRDIIGLIVWGFSQTGYGGQPENVYHAEASFIIIGCTIIAVVIGGLNAKYCIATPRVEVPIQNLPKSLHGFKIVQLSDIHLGTGPKLNQVIKIVNRAMELGGDMIALTGDIIDGNIASLTDELKQMARLKAKHGVYFVLGNHECYWKHEETIHSMKQMGFHTLQNSGVENKSGNDTFFVAGMNDPAIIHTAEHKPSDAPIVPATPPDSKLNIILVHQPQFSKKISENFNYHLQLSGHTHGGQFFPWNLAVKKMYHFPSGLDRLKNLWVYVNVGTGYWGPPIRLGTHCEITEIVLVPA